jgi:hypothetical protein
MRERYAVIRQLAPRYQRSGKKVRSQILNEFVMLTGYTRCYAAYVLKNYGVQRSIIVNGQRVTSIIGFGAAIKHHRKRKCLYDKPVEAILKRLWAISNGLCGKRLVVFIRDTIPILERFGELCLDTQVRSKLLNMSSATMDRLLAQTKAKSRLKGRSGTKPGTLLKHHIPIRTFAEWNDVQPGFVEIDLVAHDGGIASGDYMQTLDVTDIATGWTETRALKNKAQCFVFQALQDIRQTIPFSLLGIDSDNGSEFINNELLRYCEQEHITFTRSRPYRKNDNCFIEQKNYSVVRRTVGYYRYDQPQQLILLQELYSILRLYTNFFQPSMKLLQKTRIGSKITRRYDVPLTPFHRLLLHPLIADDIKRSLSNLYATLNPAQLMRSLSRLQHDLFHNVLLSPKYTPIAKSYPKEDHPWHNKSLTALILESQKNYSNTHQHRINNNASP